MKKINIILTLIITYCFCGCSDNDETTKHIAIRETHNSGCKGYISVGLQATNFKEYIEIKSSGDGDLYISHINSVYSCEQGALNVTVKNDKGKILVTEDEGNNLANCLCYYDLFYVISNLKIGTQYSIEIRKGKNIVLGCSFAYSTSLNEKIMVNNNMN